MEDEFQEFLFNNPHVMGITDDDGNMIRMIPIVREYPVRDESGLNFFIDLICLDDSGILNIIEVKRCNDPRIRREVIGQILDYASQVCYAGDVDELCGICEDAEAGAPSSQISSLLKEGENVDEYWTKVKTNLLAGKVRIIIAADGIPKNVVRIIEFLNKQMTPAEFIGVELRKYGEIEPHVFSSSIIGVTEESKVRRGQSRERRQWDRESFLKDIESQSGAISRAKAEKILAWCDSRGLRIWWGQGATRASLTPVFDNHDHNNMLFWLDSWGRFLFYFQYLEKPLNEIEWKSRLMERFNKILKTPLTIEDMSRRPGVYLEDYDDAGWDEILKQFDLMIEDLRQNQ